MSKVLWLVLFFVTSSVHANEDTPGYEKTADALSHRSEAECGEYTSYDAIAACRATIHDEAEKLMKVQYDELIEYLGPVDRRNLIRAQRLWVKFRDADCTFSEPRTGNDSLINANRNSCLANNTIERLRNLEQYNASWNKGCDICPW
jgi:uncharacterized protein YecT (DUF1311 family)